MPGNEVGDRVHNFFDQGSLSRDQHHTEFGEANWPGFHNSANEGQIGRPLNTNTKNYSGQPSENDRGQNNPFTLAPHGLNFTQPSVRPEFIKNPSQAQQPNLNGFMHTPQTVNVRQNEANFLGVDSGSNRHNVPSRNMPTIESQQRTMQHQSNTASFGGLEVPMNFNFFGSQQQMNGQQSGMFQSLPMQQSSINDGQLLQQQAMFRQMQERQMQELQRRHQLQQFEAMQRNHMSTFPNQSAGPNSHAVNGNPVQATSNYPWQSQVMNGNTNWQQQPYSNGFMINPEQAQAMRFMGSTPQQASQSLYGVPVSNSASPYPFSQNNIDKSGGFHIPASSSSFSGNPYTPQSEQLSMKYTSAASRSGSEGRASLEHASSQGLADAVDLGGFNRVQQTKMSMSDGGGPVFASGLDNSREESLMQAATSQSTSSQPAGGLDPTEEKILFGNDDNIWEAFGGAVDTGNEGANLFNEFPSIQSGTWSALMQSAVGETSSSDVGAQEEWGVLDSQSLKRRFPTSQDTDKPPPVWVDSSQRAALSPRSTSNDLSANKAFLNATNSHNPGLQQPLSNHRSSLMECQVRQEGRRWLDSNSPKPHTEEKIDTGFRNQQQKTFVPDSIPDSDMNPQVQSSGPGLRNVNINNESSQRPPDNHSLDLWKKANFASNSGFVGLGNGQQYMKKRQTSINSAGQAADVHRVENGDGRETSNDSNQNSLSNHSLPACSKENVGSEDGRRVPVARNFQYHPMGDTDKYSSATEGLHSQSASPSSGLKGHEVRPPLFAPAGSSLSDMSKGQVSGFHGGSAMLHGGLFSGNLPGYLPNTSVPFARSGENSSSNHHLPPSQDMLELLHKVDQSADHNAVSNLGSSTSNCNRSSDIPSGERVGPGQSQSSSSHGFNLQLAPPSQGITFSNLNDPAQSYFNSVGSPSPHNPSSEKGNNSHARLASSPSAQGFPPSHGLPQVDFGNDKTRGLDGSLSSMRENPPASFASNSVYPRNQFQNQDMTAAGGQMMGDGQSSHVSSDRHAYQDQQSTIYQNQSGMRAAKHQMPASLHDVMAGMRKDNISYGGPNLMTSQQQLFGAQDRGPSNFMKTHFQSNDTLDMNSFSQEKKDEVDGSRSSDCPRLGEGENRRAGDPGMSGKTSGVSQEESLGRQSMDASPSNSAASQRDTDVFHQSLKSNNTAHHSYSLLHQMQAIKTMGMDPNHHEFKRLRVPDNIPDAAQMAGKAAEHSTSGMNSMVRDPSVSQTPVSSVDARMLTFSPQSVNKNISQFPQGAIASRDTLSFGHRDPQTTFMSNIPSRVQLTGISPQMAPSWFGNYGTLKNGQLPEHSLSRVPVANNVEQQFIKPPTVVQNSSQIETAGIDTSVIANNAYSASEHVPPLDAVVPHVSSSCQVSVGPKKRKTATSDLVPWNNEIMKCFKTIQNISSAEVDWAQSSNRLLERGGNEIDSREDVSPLARPRRRLILTTKLMQQTLRPPPASILALDGRSNYEVIMYSAARLALGDSCNLICGTESDSSTDNDNGNTLSGKAKTSKRTRDQYFSKLVEDFTNRAKELDNEFLRLEKRTSILDFRLDCQDVEKFSVINRFARVHARSQADGVETSSSSDANGVSQKSFAQRYVSAQPMPSTVPERVQCLTIG